MPIVCERDDARRQFVARATGELSLQDALEFVATYRIGEFRKYSLLFDATDATLNAPTRHVVALADHAAGMRATEGPGGPVAIVASRPFILSVARMFQLLVAARGVEHIGVFRNVTEAEDWLATL